MLLVALVPKELPEYPSEWIHFSQRHHISANVVIPTATSSKRTGIRRTRWDVSTPFVGRKDNYGVTYWHDNGIRGR